MFTKEGDRIAVYRDGERIVLGMSVRGRTIEAYLTPKEAEGLVHDLIGQIFRLTGTYSQAGRKEG